MDSFVSVEVEEGERGLGRQAGPRSLSQHEPHSGYQSLAAPTYSGYQSLAAPHSGYQYLAAPTNSGYHQSLAAPTNSCTTNL